MENKQLKLKETIGARRIESTHGFVRVNGRIGKIGLKVPREKASINAVARRSLIEN
jgi:hypothetical protein